MDTNLTDITFLLDRSGSMSSIKESVIEGINAFIDTQKQCPGKAKMTLIQFDSDDPNEIVYNARDIQSVRNMERSDFQPRGGTPLLDAMGKAISQTGERLKDMPECERPSKVVFVSFSDGGENQSIEFNRKKIKEMIEHQTQVYNWDFIFLGCGFDAFSEAGGIGISKNTTAGFTSSNIRAAVGLTAGKLASYRSSGMKTDLDYTDLEREALNEKQNN